MSMSYTHGVHMVDIVALTRGSKCKQKLGIRKDYFVIRYPEIHVVQ